VAASILSHACFSFPSAPQPAPPIRLTRTGQISQFRGKIPASEEAGYSNL